MRCMRPAHIMHGEVVALLCMHVRDTGGAHDIMMRCMRLAHNMHGEAVALLCMHVRDMRFMAYDVCAWRTTCTAKPWRCYVCRCVHGTHDMRLGCMRLAHIMHSMRHYYVRCVRLAHNMHGEAVALLCMHVRACVRLVHIIHGEAVTLFVLLYACGGHEIHDMPGCTWPTPCTARPWHDYVCMRVTRDSRHAMYALGRNHARRDRGITRYACAGHGMHDMQCMRSAHIMHGARKGTGWS